MFHNPIYHSTFFNTHSFPKLYPRVAGAPNTLFDSPSDPQNLLTHPRAPHSPYNLRLLPPKDYQNSNPKISISL